jgi:hypothetical protein
MPYRRAENLDKNRIFFEPFNDEQSVRRNGGVPTDVIFNKGVGEFNGSTSVVEYSGYNDISPRPSSFRCKVKFDDEGDAVVFQILGKNGNAMNLGIRAANGVLGFGSQLSVYRTVLLSAFDFTEWHEIVGTVDSGGTTTLYIDGVSTSHAGSAGWDPSGNSFKIGGRGALGALSLQFGGDLEFLEFYNKVLTAEEVSNLYNDARYVLPNLEHEQQVGDDLNLSSCMNSGSSPYTTFSNGTRTGFNVTSDGVGNMFAGTADEIPIIAGSKYLAEFDCVLNGGLTAPTYKLSSALVASTRSNVGTAVNGHNSFILVATANDTGVLSFLHSSATADYEISNLSLKLVVVEPTSKILHVNSFDGVCRNLLSLDTIEGELVDEVANTDIDIFKDGDIRTILCNGSTSLVDAGDYSDLVGDITVLAWVNPFTYGEGSGFENGRVLDNGKLYIALRNTNVFRVSSDGDVTKAHSGSDSVKLYQWQSVVVTRTAAGVVNIYVDGELSGSADQATGTPVAGTNIIIGNNNAGARTWDGKLSDIRIVRGLLTPNEISQVFTSEKANYFK